MPDEPFEGRFPFAPHYDAVHGFAMQYVDEGEGEPFVLRHGDPTWGYLFRSCIPPFPSRVAVVFLIT